MLNINIKVMSRRYDEEKNECKAIYGEAADDW